MGRFDTRKAQVTVVAEYMLLIFGTIALSYWF